MKEKIGSTGSGTGPANAERAMRTLKMAKDVESLSSYVIDVPDEVNSALKDQKKCSNRRHSRHPSIIMARNLPVCYF